MLVSARDETVLRETAREIGERTGAEVDYQVADLRRAGDIRALVGRILVTNAGGPLLEPSDTVGA